MGYRNITIQPGKVDDRKSEVIAFVINTRINVTANKLSFIFSFSV